MIRRVDPGFFFYHDKNKTMATLRERKADGNGKCFLCFHGET